jgi:hypothetical protein
MANKCHHVLKGQLRTYYLNTQTKYKLYKTLLRPVLIYGSQRWALIKYDEAKLKVFERKMLKNLYGLINRLAHGELDVTMNYTNCTMNPA